MSTLPRSDYIGDAKWTVPSSIEAMVEQTLPEQFVPRLTYYPIIINTIPKERLERIHNAVSAVFYVENSDPQELAGQLDKLESILKEQEDSALEVFQRVGRWIRNYLETGGRGDPATIEAVSSMREVKAMFGTKLERYGEQKVEEGREEGREASRVEGRERSQEEIARRMIERGFSTQEISELTGLAPERIKTLRK